MTKADIYYGWFCFPWFRHQTHFEFDRDFPYVQHQYSIGCVAFCWKEYEKL